ncbi:DUF4974 domain-containing protein [Chitinophagaceae bacterium 26-R-25]|nr:DUF4974 domain-containing protein [Chitinophagaceae bacterium 26-R-25]
MGDKNIADLLGRFFKGKITPEEKNILADLISISEDEELDRLMEQAWDQFEPAETVGIDQSRQMLQAILMKGKDEEAGQSKVINIRSRRWWRVGAAAIIIGIIGSGILIFFNHSSSPKDVQNIAVVKPTKPDIAAPNSVNAVLTLANGQQVVLDSVQNGALASQGAASISKLSSDKIAYNSTGAENSKIEYNTLTVPRGSRIIHLVLADGTSVFLNAASSITYPTAFSGNERKVEVSGEAYFDVARDPMKSFIVSANGVNTEVLGTQFNVNAYNDDGSIDVTLLQGRVKIANDENSTILAPGQQGQLNKKGKIDLNKDVDTDQVMAWKNGLFNFNNQSVESIMLQISRWYNVRVVYEGKRSEKHFSGIMSRNDNISAVLKIMQLAGIQFKIEGDVITVSQ